MECSRTSPTGWVPALLQNSQIPLYREAWQAALSGNAGPARRLIEDADDIRVENYLPPTAIALLALKIHDLDNLFHWLDVAYHERCPALPYVYLTPGFPRAILVTLEIMAASEAAVASIRPGAAESAPAGNPVPE